MTRIKTPPKLDSRERFKHDVIGLDGLVASVSHGLFRQACADVPPKLEFAILLVGGNVLLAHKRILVLGGGISGLVCSYRLAQRGAQVTLIESAAHMGGAIQTQLESGYLTELGPNSIQVTTPVVEKLLSEIGLESEVATPLPSAKKRYIVRNDRLYAVPASLMAGAATGLFRFRAKLRLLADLWIKKRVDKTDESLAAFVRRRLGPEFLDYAINPMIGGIYAGDPERLSTQHAFPKIHRLEQEHGGLIKGALRLQRIKKNDVGSTPTKMLSFRNGMAALPKKLEQVLGDSAIKGAQIKSLSQKNGVWQAAWSRQESGADMCEEAFHSVVVAVPAHAIAKLPWERSLKSELSFFSELDYPPLASISLGFARQQIEHPLDGFGMLVPEKENRSVLGTLFTSSMFEGRAPAGKVHLTTFVGGSRQPELARLEASALLEVVLRDLSQLLGVSGDPERSNITVWKRAIPQYTVGYGRYLDAMDAVEQQRAGLYFCGNYRHGISVEKCILSATQLAERMTS